MHGQARGSIQFDYSRDFFIISMSYWLYREHIASSRSAPTANSIVFSFLRLQAAANECPMSVVPFENPISISNQLCPASVTD